MNIVIPMPVLFICGVLVATYILWEYGNFDNHDENEN